MAKCKNCKQMIWQKVVFNYTTTEYPYCPALEECLDDIDKEIVCSGFEGITNADRIRSMTDEELVKVIMCPYEEEYSDCREKDCYECILEWLKSKVGCE